MQIIERNTTNPYINIATEEYLIKNIAEPCFMLWQNSPSVIVGKHQNPLREVNLDYCQKNKIPVIRRISGGGTVYHDLGNLNYSFIDFGKAESLVNFAKYSRPIIDLLQSWNVDAQLVGKSDLKIHQQKFSGNASHVYKNRVLHHGTLLFNADLNILNESIKIEKENISDKAVNSNRSVVTNILPHLENEMNIEEFKNKLVQHIKIEFPEAKEKQLTAKQENEIYELAEEKYKIWKWNFGYSPKYTISGSIPFQDQEIEIQIIVKKGFIDQITFPLSFSSPLLKEIQKLIGTQHEKQSILNKLSTIEMGNFSQELFKLLF